MGTADKINYPPLQDLVREIARAAEAAPIDFDIYAWNAEHGHVTQTFIQNWARSADGTRPPRERSVEPRPEKPIRHFVPKSQSGIRDWRWFGRKRRSERT